jgi:hypothetical protein
MTSTVRNYAYGNPNYGEAIADVREAATRLLTAALTSSRICVPVSTRQRAPDGKSKPCVTTVKLGMQQERDRRGKEVSLE